MIPTDDVIIIEGYKDFQAIMQHVLDELKIENKINYFYYAVEALE